MPSYITVNILVGMSTAGKKKKSNELIPNMKRSVSAQGTTFLIFILSAMKLRMVIEPEQTSGVSVIRGIQSESTSIRKY